MITQDNLKEVINQLDNKDKRRIELSMKEYCVLFLHSFNVGSYTEIVLTDNFNKYKNVSNNGNCILETSEVLNILLT